MKRRHHYFVIIFLFTFFNLFYISCKDSITQSDQLYPTDNQHKVTISQGVWGNVWFWEGDFMPPIDNKYAIITPVVRDVYVYEATDQSKVEMISYSPFFKNISSNLITIVQSDEDGFFQVDLATGKYSFFVKEDTLFYANEWDGDGHILSALVTENQVTKRQIDITYKAAF